MEQQISPSGACPLRRYSETCRRRQRVCRLPRLHLGGSATPFVAWPPRNAPTSWPFSAEVAKRLFYDYSAQPSARQPLGMAILW